MIPVDKGSVYRSSILARIGSILVLTTALIGVPVVVYVVLMGKVDSRAVLTSGIGLLLSAAYFLGGLWLWKGLQRGWILSSWLTGLAVINIDTERFYFSLTNGFAFVVTTDERMTVDVWSAIILMILLWARLRRPKAGSDVPASVTPSMITTGGE